MALMTNIQYSYEGEELVLRIRLDQKAQPAKSGSSMLIASSWGFKNLWRDGLETEIELSMNLRRPFRDDERLT